MNGQIDIPTIIFYLIFFILLPFLYLRMSYWQVLIKLDSLIQFTNKLLVDARKNILRKLGKKRPKKTNELINNFLEFFMIRPVDLDPYGIVGKLEHVLNLYERRFKRFVNRIAPSLDSETKANIVMGLSGAIMLNQIKKILRHYGELIRKTKNIQIAFLIQMQLPLIEKLVKALGNGVEAFVNSWPIGDGIGSLAAASMIKKFKVKEMDETMVAEGKISGRDVIIVKAKGPGGRLGKIGRVVEKIVKGRKVAKIITIDASLKLEGEKTGSVAEGVGVAVGGLGVDKAYIENIATKKRIPLDSIIIKMSQEEAIMPMKKEIFNSLGRIKEIIEDNIKLTREKGVILIVGVGNSCGIDNNEKAVEKVKNVLKKVWKRKKKEKKERGILSFFGE